MLCVSRLNKEWNLLCDSFWKEKVLLEWKRNGLDFLPFLIQAFPAKPYPINWKKIALLYPFRVMKEDCREQIDFRKPVWITLIQLCSEKERIVEFDHYSAIETNETMLIKFDYYTENSKLRFFFMRHMMPPNPSRVNYGTLTWIEKDLLYYEEDQLPCYDSDDYCFDCSGYGSNDECERCTKKQKT